MMIIDDVNLANIPNCFNSSMIYYVHAPGKLQSITLQPATCNMQHSRYL
jgi:hypothetical protein